MAESVPNLREGPRAALALLALSLVIYGNSLQNDFVFDDLAVIVQNPAVQRLDLNSIFGNNTWLNDPIIYRPWTMLSFAANAALDARPWGFRLVNVLLNGLCAALVFGLGLRLFQSRPAAWMAGLLFVAHPIHAEAVNLIVGRAELWACLFSLLCLLLLLHGWGRLSALAFALGLLSKENAMAVAPLLFLVLAREKRLRSQAPFFVLAVGLAFLLRRHAIGGGMIPQAVEIPVYSNPLAFQGLPEKLWSILFLFARSCELLLWPARLSIDYSDDVIAAVLALSGLAKAALIVWPALLAGLSARLALRSWSLALLLGLCWLPLPPIAVNLVYPATVFGERHLYLPSAGLCLLAGLAFAGFLRRRRRLALGFGALACIALAARTCVRSTDWKDGRTLYSRTLAVAPLSARMHYNLAEALLEAGEVDAARVHTLRALRSQPRHALAYLQLSILETRAGRLPIAQRAVEAAVRLERNPQALLLKARLDAALGGVGSPGGLAQALAGLRQAYREAGAEAEASLVSEALEVLGGGKT